MYCIETEDLQYRFSNEQQVLKGINLRVPENSIYGFLGPNGAGKTTTLRLLLGLLRNQAGTIHLFGKSFDKYRIEILRNTGSLIETPSHYGHLTAVENLRILQKVYRCDSKRIAEVLEIVGLSDTGNKKSGRFSLGMKQRLGIAVAILHQPELLILDEPTNGLDPNGIIEMRELLKKLNKESGMTILISSHLLSEIEKLVSHLGIIHKGSLLFQGKLEELHQKQKQSAITFFDTSNNIRVTEIMRAEGQDPSHQNGRISVPTIDKSTLAVLNRKLVMEGIDVFQIHTHRTDLESIFMDLVQN